MGIESHREIQELQVDKVLRFLGYIVIPVLLVNLSRYFILGWLFSFNLYIFSTVLILAVSLNTAKLSYAFKVSFLMFIFLGLAISTGLNFGMVSFMTEFLLLTVFLSVIFLQKKAAIAVWVLCGLLCAGTAILCIMGVLPLVPDFEQHVNSIPSWLSFFVTFLFMAGIIILIAGDIGNLLAAKIKALEEKNVELVKANEKVYRLQEIVPICSRCKKVRDDKGYWNQVESYIESHSDVKISHSTCEECADKLYGSEDWYLAMKKR
jgi:hypothetical protein